MLARSGALIACATLAVAVAGCAAPAPSTVNVSGKSLVVYLSRPAGGEGGQQAQDILDAERLAFQQNGNQIGSFTVKAVVLDGRELSDNARTAIEDKTAIAYIGEVVPGTSADSLGITNDQDLLEVSPTDTAVEVTQAVPTVSGSPKVYYELFKTYGQTFVRVVPTSKLEAKALVGEMQAQHVSSVYVTDDGEHYGATIAYYVKQDARAAGLTLATAAGSADGVFYGGSSVAGAARLFDQVSAGNPAAKLFAPSALANTALISSLSPAGQRALHVSEPGFLPSDLPPAGQQFVAAFRTAYGHAPATEAIFGYEAAQAVIAVLREAGASANSRSAVVKDFLEIKNRSSVLGTYSIDSFGDTSIAPFVFSHVVAGALEPYRAAQQ